MKIQDLLLTSLLIALIILIFKQWFSLDLIAGGDFQVYYSEMFRDFSNFPLPAWNLFLNGGMGGNSSSLLWNLVAVQIPITFFGLILKLDWNLIQRLGYFYPFLFLIFFPIFFTFRKILKFPFLVLACLIYATNTYILMIAGGGQIFIAGSYAIAPLVLYTFYQVINSNSQSRKENIKKILHTVVFFSLQLLLDIRIAYVTLVCVILFILVRAIKEKRVKIIYKVIPVAVILILSFSIHAFWFIPTVLIGRNPLEQFGTAFTSLGSVKFFSFADFPASIALLHPNWPENIFGKTYFMKPEFIIIPIIAFSSILLLSKGKKDESRLIAIFFSLLAILGSFLSKGANDPFGNIYIFLFENVPGFVMFRDPTKWYIMTVLSFSFIIPFTVQKLSDRYLKKEILRTTTLICFFIFWVFLIRDGVFGSLGGNLSSSKVPEEYLRLKEFILSEKKFSRTLWLPKTQRYIYYSSNHPAGDVSSLFRNSSLSANFKLLKQDKTEELLSNHSIKYLVVPFDSEKEIFLEDREYREKNYMDILREVRSIDYLSEIYGLGKIAVFEISNPKDHFWSPSETLSIDYKYVNPSKYVVNVKSAKKGDTLVFSESFDNLWQAQVNDSRVGSEMFNGRLNSFKLPRGGDYSLTIYFAPQDWVKLGAVISIISILVVMVTLIGFKLRKW